MSGWLPAAEIDDCVRYRRILVTAARLSHVRKITT